MTKVPCGTAQYRIEVEFAPCRAGSRGWRACWSVQLCRAQQARNDSRYMHDFRALLYQVATKINPDFAVFGRIAAAH